MNDKIQKNGAALDKEFKWLSEVIRTRLSMHLGLGQHGNIKTIYEVKPPDFLGDVSYYAGLARQLPFEERIVLALSLAPHLRPGLLDVFYTRNTQYDRVHTEFGGLKGKRFSGFLPTGETAIFIIAGTDIATRIQCIDIFRPTHFFASKNILTLSRSESNEPLLSGMLEISDEYLNYFTTGRVFKPDFSSNFPAKLLTTKLDLPDLVLDPHVLAELSELWSWVEHQEKIMVDWGLQKHLKRGYRALFYGPPGTGKSLTATLIGKRMNLDVYRIDLSQVVSKYIGETEKNLASIFDQAENKGWILFFDEADALFGKRTATSDSKDRHANQEVAYLLQRIEDYSGVIVLATNLKANMDIAFTRRFQSIIYFPLPNYEQRLVLWRNAFAGGLQLDEDVNFEQLANDHALAGGNIINILRYCSLSALRRGGNKIYMEDITDGIKKELRKEGKTM
jgi:Cdc6-like AAA superfamily ATPase